MNITNQRFKIFLILIVVLLSVPLIAMQFTLEVNWTVFDFLVAGLLLIINALSIEFVLQKCKSKTRKIMICSIILLVLFLIWIELAVGIFGSVFSGS